MTPDERAALDGNAMQQAMRWCIAHMPACRYCGSHFWWETISTHADGTIDMQCHYCGVRSIVMNFVKPEGWRGE